MHKSHRVILLFTNSLYFFQYDVPFVRVADEIDHQFGRYAVPHESGLGNADEPEPGVTDRETDAERADDHSEIGPRRLLIQLDVLVVLGAREPHLSEGPHLSAGHVGRRVVAVRTPPLCYVRPSGVCQPHPRFADGKQQLSHAGQTGRPVGRLVAGRSHGIVAGRSDVGRQGQTVCRRLGRADRPRQGRTVRGRAPGRIAQVRHVHSDREGRSGREREQQRPARRSSHRSSRAYRYDDTTPMPTRCWRIVFRRTRPRSDGKCSKHTRTTRPRQTGNYIIVRSDRRRIIVTSVGFLKGFPCSGRESPDRGNRTRKTLTDHTRHRFLFIY